MYDLGLPRGFLPIPASTSSGIGKMPASNFRNSCRSCFYVLIQLFSQVISVFKNRKRKRKVCVFVMRQNMIFPISECADGCYSLVEMCDLVTIPPIRFLVIPPSTWPTTVKMPASNFRNPLGDCFYALIQLFPQVINIFKNAEVETNESNFKVWKMCFSLISVTGDSWYSLL